MQTLLPVQIQARYELIFFKWKEDAV